MTTNDARVDALAAGLAASDGLNWDEVCGYEADHDECDRGTCVAAHYEDHDPELARSNYRKWARVALTTLTARVQELLDARVAVRDRVAAVSGYGGDGDIENDDRLVDVVADLARDLTAATARVGALERALRGVRNDLHNKNRLNTHSIVCTIWHDAAETTVDFIDAALASDPAAKPSEGAAK